MSPAVGRSRYEHRESAVLQSRCSPESYAAYNHAPTGCERGRKGQICSVSIGQPGTISRHHFRKVYKLYSSRSGAFSPLAWQGLRTAYSWRKVLLVFPLSASRCAFRPTYTSSRTHSQPRIDHVSGAPRGPLLCCQQQQHCSCRSGTPLLSLATRQIDSQQTCPQNIAPDWEAAGIRHGLGWRR